jgi:Zn-dependent protease
MIMAINIALAAFNLIPIPPLDGFGLLINLLPRPIAASVAPIAAYGPIILLALVFLGPALHVDALGMIMDPIRAAITRLIVGIARIGA